MTDETQPIEAVAQDEPPQDLPEQEPAAAERVEEVVDEATEEEKRGCRSLPPVTHLRLSRPSGCST
jgi:hypothetical protein